MDETPRHIQIKNSAYSTAGDYIRSIDLILKHHTDRGFPVEEETKRVIQKALGLLCEKYLGADAILLMDSSTMQLPKLSQSDRLEISQFIGDARKDNHAPDGND